MGNQKLQGVAWNLDESVNQEDNNIVTNNVLDFVSAQITESKGLHWTQCISSKDLKQKIKSVFSRQKGERNMPAEKALLLKKQNTKKTRRVTVSYFEV